MSFLSVAVSRATRAFVLVLCTSAVAITGCKTGPDSGRVVQDTVKAWGTDEFVPSTDPTGASKNAARILAMEERTCDRVMQVGASGAIVHQAPSATSAQLGRVDAFDAVRVTAEADFMRVAPADAPNDTNRQAGNMKEFIGADGGAVTPTWVRVKTGSVEGWMPARALVQPLELALSSESMAQARAANAAGSANKGFSEKMKRSTTAMKGAAGTPQIKGANYAVAGQIAERIDAPLPLAVDGDPFSPVARAQSLKSVGQPLATLDPSLAVQAAEVQMKSMEPPAAGKTMEAGASLLGGIGVKQADDPNVKLGIELTKLIEDVSRPTPITPVEERVLGLECLAVCIGDSRVLPDSHPVSAYVRWVGAQVAAPSSMPYPAMGLEFIVIDDSETPNAMAVPGGPIVITTGMLDFLDSEDELAVILAHEMAHIEERHGLKQAADAGMDRLPRLLSFADSLANGQFDSMAKSMLRNSGLSADLTAQLIAQAKPRIRQMIDDTIADSVNAVMQQAVAGQNQGIETAADLRGMSLAAAAGYNPAALEAILERISALTGSYGGANYSAERLAQAREVMAMLPAPNGGTWTPLSAGGAVIPSERAAANWKRLDDELKR
jgi:hypothetical protein